MNDLHKSIGKLISKYAEVRKEMKIYKEKYKKYLAGNDNYVGSIGEYWSIIFIEQFYKNEIQEFLERRENWKVSESEEWFDIELKHKSDIYEYISVKTIFEDKRNTSGYIKPIKEDIENKKLKENDILSVIILKLNEELRPIELLYIKDINNNLVDGIKDYKTRWSERKQINFRFYDNTGFDDNLDVIYKYENGVFWEK